MISDEWLDYYSTKRRDGASRYEAIRLLRERYNLRLEQAKEVSIEIEVGLEQYWLGVQENLRMEMARLEESEPESEPEPEPELGDGG